MDIERKKKGQFVKGENIKDISGNRYGKLTVVCLDRERTRRKSYWICKCDCGKIKSIRSDTLNRIKSCGCVKKQQDIVNLGINYNHNMTHEEVFTTWNAMINRCLNPNNHAYKDYGGRGITVCDEWKDVKKFVDWAKKSGYQKGLSIERIDVNGNYEPKNCKWIPRSEQALNTRKTVYILHNGEKIPLAKTARELGVSPSLAWNRWEKGMSYEDIFYPGNLLYKK